MRNIQQVLERWGAGQRVKVVASTFLLLQPGLRICYPRRSLVG